ncbi:ribosomal protein S18-alanine N-acetyltransferase [Lactobacillus sp. ESL0679]|uniref:ribosomal protein S18-alanine N-acetyltransferase n=1 Tax=Lactobacillus sp. ESL0679 TaxID=2983209 RepID=UPI0032AFF4B3
MSQTVIMWKKFKQHNYFSHFKKQPLKVEFQPFVFVVAGQTVQVMRAKPDDISNMLLLETQAYDGETPWNAEVFQSELAKPNLLYLVVYQSSTLIAYAGVRINKLEGHITNLAVAPNWQGQGLGTRLMQIMIELAQKWGCEYVSLEVRVDNLVAQKLYCQLGFSTTFVRPNYYQETQTDGLNMVLKLTQKQDKKGIKF